MGVGTFLLIFILTPIFVDVVLFFIAISHRGNKIMLLTLVILYLTCNLVIPILVLHKYYLEKIGSENFLYGIALIILFRLIEIFGASLGKTFTELWRNN